MLVDPATATPGPTGIATLSDPVVMSVRDLLRSMVAVSETNQVMDALYEAGVPTELSTEDLRTLADARRLRDRCASPRRFAVIGGGWAGLAAAV